MRLVSLTPGCRRLRRIRFAPLLLLLASGDLLASDAPPPVDYNREVRPILSGNCFACHGPDEGKRKAGLRIDRRADALREAESGDSPIVPGKPGESAVLDRILDDDPGRVMPPPSTHKALTDRQKETIRRWIAEGAEYREHWAFRKPARPEPPAVEGRAWPRNGVDRFVLARLEGEGLSPAPEASRTTLIRRLSLDLIGLPPTIAEIDAFLGDESPDAYEKVVDRLLASPHYGERWARRWLDRARYADTNGYEKDRERSIWPYRDWVIAALNDDLPFDRFTVEQIAGDMLPGATTAQKVASGFHRNTMINEEGGIDVEEFRFASVVDRVATTGSTWLGLTIQCAQCHTHKFDPITQRDYYRFLAFFDNADEPDFDLPSPEIEARRAEIASKIAALESGLEAKFPASATPPVDGPTAEDRKRALAEKLAAWESGKSPVRWSVARPSGVVSRKNATMTVLGDDSVLATGDRPNNDAYDVVLPTDLEGITAIRLEVLPDPSLPDGGPGRAPLFSVGDFLLTEVELSASPKSDPARRRSIRLKDATQDHAAPGKSAAMAVDGKHDTGWSIAGKVGEPHAAVFALDEPIVDKGATLSITLHQEYIHQTTIGRFRVSVTNDPGPVVASGLPADVEPTLLIPREARSEAQTARLKAYYLSVAPELAAEAEAIRALRRSMPRFPTTMVMAERPAAQARTTRIRKRGEFLQPTVAVDPGVPDFLPGLPPGAKADRLALARWVASPENPLTARVAVNQAWEAFFGRGLVATVEDFGTRGEEPSHPGLLDWLAVEFVEGGWGMKALHRRIVTSATYRQSSEVTPDRLAADPRNRLLGRGARFRVDAEVVRDVALAASGLLNPRLGGPSVYPPQPEGVTSLAYGMMKWPSSEGPDRYRRGLYTFSKRTAPYATFGTFDAPSPESACVRRERSNTPLQALALLNDRVFIEASRALAGRVLAERSADREGRIRLAFRLCLGRGPSARESSRVSEFLEGQIERFRSGSADPGAVLGDAKAPPGVEPGEFAAWTAAARAVLNLDEAITRE